MSVFLIFINKILSLVGFTKSPVGIKTNAGLPRELFSPVFNTNRGYSFCLVNVVISLESSEMLFTELFDQWWSFYKQEIKRSSIASLSGNIKEIKDDFGIGIKVSKIDPKYVQSYLDKLDCSRNKKERNKSVLNLAFDYAIDLGIIKDNPDRRAKLPRVKKTLEDWKKVEQKYLEEDEIKMLLKELYRRPNTYRIGLLSEFMSLNGCRIGEAVGIEPHNVDYESNIL